MSEKTTLTYKEMHECKHEWESEITPADNFWECQKCGKSIWGDDVIAESYLLMSELVSNRKRIKTLEGVVEAVKRDIGEHHDFIESDGELDKCRCEICKALAKLEEV